jgi:hypothetical protein
LERVIEYLNELRFSSQHSGTKKFPNILKILERAGAKSANGNHKKLFGNIIFPIKTFHGRGAAVGEANL